MYSSSFSEMQISVAKEVQLYYKSDFAILKEKRGPEKKEGTFRVEPLG